MNYLLDTHTFLWFINDDAALSFTAKALIEVPESTIYLSVASIWEMAIKISLHKLELPSPFSSFINEQLHMNTITLLDIKTSHAEIVTLLPFHHRDPFDRLIIAQAKDENMPILSKDTIFDEYGIDRYW